MTRKETISLLSIITTAYPSAELTNEQVELWVHMLQDVPFDLGQSNLKQHILSSRFSPTIADVAKRDVGVGGDNAGLEETADRFSEMAVWEQQALPACPDHHRPKFLGRGRVVGD